MTKRLARYLISFGAALVICIGLSVWQCGIYRTEAGGTFHGISNGCFACAVLFLGIALLGLIARGGAFNAIRYFGRVLKCQFSRQADEDRVLESYYDFTRKMEEKDRKKGSLLFLFLPGLAALLAALLALIPLMS